MEIKLGTKRKNSKKCFILFKFSAQMIILDLQNMWPQKISQKKWKIMKNLPLGHNQDIFQFPLYLEK